jgi:hypothetical protein
MQPYSGHVNMPGTLSTIQHTRRVQDENMDLEFDHGNTQISWAGFGIWPPLWVAPKDWETFLNEGEPVEYVESRIEAPFLPWDPSDNSVVERSERAIVGSAELERHIPLGKELGNAIVAREAEDQRKSRCRIELLIAKGSGVQRV